MTKRYLFLLAFMPLAACVTQPVPSDLPPEPVEMSGPPVPEPSDPSPEELVPGACELLLSSLEATRPLLNNLDESLAGQAEQFQAAIDRLSQPPPEPATPDCPAAGASALGQKEIIGAIEWLYMDPPGKNFRARVDSGAETSSLSAADIVEFERDGDDWVRFVFQHDSSDEAVEFELPIKRAVLIRQLLAEETERRFVVEIDVRLGDQLQSTEFMLTDRGRMTYPISLGRAFLMDLYVVDVSRSFTHDQYEASD